MSDSLEPMRAARGAPQPLPTSLLSAAHTVKPSLGPARTPRVRRARKSRLGVVVLGVGAAALGLAGAASLSHFRARPTPVMQIVSGSPALKKSSDGDTVRWHSHKTTLYLDASLELLGGRARDAVQLGFGAWLGSGAKLPRLSFDSTKGAHFGSTPNGKSEVMYGPITLQGHENDLALTITFSDPKSGEVLESDMIFNSNHAYALLPDNVGSAAHNATPGANATCSDKYDLQNVATHEAGHFFGLGEDYDVKTATMFYTTGRCETNKRALQSSDETTMDGLYVASDADASGDSSADTGKGCGGARIGLGKTGGEGSLWAVAGVLAFVRWRRRRR